MKSIEGSLTEKEQETMEAALKKETSQLEREISYFECLFESAAAHLLALETAYEGNERALEKPPSYIEPLGGSLALLSLPSSFFEIIMKEETSLKFLQTSGVIPEEKDCACGGKMELSKNKLGYFLYACDCGNFSNILEGPFWSRVPLSVDKILLCMFLWSLNNKEREISNFSGIPYLEVKNFIGKLRTIIARHFEDSFVKFSGIVEIDESCFLKNPLNKEKPKWVFGLYERASKRCYMEVVKERTSHHLIPIIIKTCEPGTTIISDQWAAYNKLTDYGFPHFTVDHSRFFVNPNNREIHTQHIEISWGWAKYHIKAKGRRRGDLQEYLNEFCWLRQFKSIAKVEEMAGIIKNLFQVIQNYQDLVNLNK